MRPDGFFCSVTAAVIIGVPLPRRLESERDLHVAVPHPVRAPEGKGILGHKVRLMGDDVLVWEGLRLSSPDRVWCELAPLLTLPQLVAAGDFLVHREYPLTTIERLNHASSTYPSRIAARLRRDALPHLDTGSESARESELRVLIALAGIRGFVPNLTVRVPGATYRGDLVNVEKRVIIEYQSAYHFDPAQQRRDMTRMERLRAAGWYVLQVNTDDMDDPDELTARIRSVLDSRPSMQ
jgi:very-short-patch-repair endonuclease